MNRFDIKADRFCRCLSCRMQLVLDDTRYPLDRGIKHTRFMLFRCKDCGNLKGFPEENLMLFLMTGLEEDVEAFAREYMT